MRNLASRLEKLEEHFASVACTCTAVVVVAEGPEHEFRELSQSEIDLQLAGKSRCPVHATPTGLLVIIRRFSVTSRTPSVTHA